MGGREGGPGDRGSGDAVSLCMTTSDLEVVIGASTRRPQGGMYGEILVPFSCNCMVGRYGNFRRKSWWPPPPPPPLLTPVSACGEILVSL